MARYDNSKRPAKTLGADGTLYDSGWEYRAFYAMRAKGATVHYNDLVLQTPNVGGGQYKMDGWFTSFLDSSDHMHIIEIKGYMQDRDWAVVAEMKSRLRAPHSRRGVNLESFSLCQRQGTLVWTRETIDEYPSGMAGAMYACPECKTAYIAQNAHHECPHCGREGEFVTDDLNTFANEHYEKTTWGKLGINGHWSRTPWAKKAIGEIKDRLGDVGVEILPDKSYPKIASPFEYNGSYTPAVCYLEKQGDVTSLGTANDPYVLVEVIDIHQLDADAEMCEIVEKNISYLNSLVDDRDCLIRKMVTVSQNGTWVYDGKDGKARPGSRHKCSKCKTGFLAADDNAVCPNCGTKARPTKA